MSDVLGVMALGKSRLKQEVIGYDINEKRRDMPNPKDTKELSFYADPERSKLHPGCECCIHSEKRLQRALEAEAREYELLQKLKAIKEQMPLLENLKLLSLDEWVEVKYYMKKCPDGSVVFFNMVAQRLVKYPQGIGARSVINIGKVE